MTEYGKVEEPTLRSPRRNARKMLLDAVRKRRRQAFLQLLKK